MNDNAKWIAGILAVGLSGLLGWSLLATHEMAKTVARYEGQVGILKFAMESYHSQPTMIDTEPAVLFASYDAEPAGYAVNPHAGLEACVGGLTAALPTIRRDPDTAEKNLLKLLSYLTGRHCELTGTAIVECR